MKMQPTTDDIRAEALQFRPKLSIAAEPVKFYYLPNEPDPDFFQVGPRRAFGTLAAAGRISEFRVFSFLKEARRLGNAAAVGRRILDEVISFKPDILFWQHVSGFNLESEFMPSLRQASPKTLLVYHEGDAYGRVHKRYPPATRHFIGSFDLVFQVALGPAQRLSERVGAKRIYWTPHSFDAERFPLLPVPYADSRQHEAIMIGDVIRRIPGIWELPGSGDRYRLAARLWKLLGSKFAVYGDGWNIPASKGPLPYEQQHQAIRQAWVSVGWDHFPRHAYYFSTRLPIALAAGVPHVTSYHPGYENVLHNCPGLILAQTVQEAVDGTLYFLSLDRQKLIDLGAACRDFAFNNFEATKVYTTVFNKCLEHLDEKTSRAGSC
jgi:hypothetical protein